MCAATTSAGEELRYRELFPDAKACIRLVSLMGAVVRRRMRFIQVLTLSLPVFTVPQH
jgi:hypothetical protein